VRADIRFLSSDLLEGRGPATRGERLAREYLASRFEAIGLEPGAPGGSWEQPFDLVGVTTACPEVLRVSRGEAGEDLRYLEDYVAFSGVPAVETILHEAEIVFVGYGIVAPEHRWDDFKGADLSGRVLLVMNSDPETDPQIFAGKRRLRCGRWDYKARDGGKLAPRSDPHPHRRLGRIRLEGGPDVLDRRAAQPARHPQEPTCP
jgi:hypothetical protein